MLKGRDISWYLEILGILCFSAPEAIATTWTALPEERRDAFLAAAMSDGAGAFCLGRLGDLAGPRYSDAIKRRRSSDLLTAMIRENHLKTLFAFFEKHHIRFAPFKGADLAYRVYPSPSMRPFGDFDILFHPDDLERACQLLIDDGWAEQGHVDQAVHHHLAPLTRNGIMVEPHWTLSRFEGTSPEAIWQHVITVTSCRHILSPELNILTFTRHASEAQYRWLPISKLLLDCAMVMAHDGCDWTKLRELSAELGQPYAGNLLAAFPEFFPNELLEAMEADSDSAHAYRRIFEERDQQGEIDSSEVTVLGGGVFTLHWWKIRFSMLHPANIRRKYKLPSSGAPLRLAWAMFRDVAAKTCDFVKYSLHPHRDVQDFLALISRAEQRNV